MERNLGAGYRSAEPAELVGDWYGLAASSAIPVLSPREPSVITVTEPTALGQGAVARLTFRNRARVFPFRLHRNPRTGGFSIRGGLGPLPVRRRNWRLVVSTPAGLVAAYSGGSLIHLSGVVVFASSDLSPEVARELLGQPNNGLRFTVQDLRDLRWLPIPAAQP